MPADSQPAAWQAAELAGVRAATRANREVKGLPDMANFLGSTAGGTAARHT